MHKSLLTLILVFATTFLSAQPGELVTNFADDGVFIFDETFQDEIQDMAYLSDGSIIVSGYFYTGSYVGVLMKLSPEGEVLWYKQFDVYGDEEDDFFQGVVVRNDEIFVQSNSFNALTGRTDVVILKCHQNGLPDLDYGENGLAVASYNNGIAGFEMQIDGNGNLYVIGRTLEFSTTQEDGAVIKFTSDGMLDASFGTNGISIQGIGGFRTGFVEGMLINDELYAVGWFWDTGTAVAIDENGVVVKLNADGTRDMDFANNGTLIIDLFNDDIINDIERHGENHFLTATTAGPSSDDIYIKRYDLEGNLDQNFATKGTLLIDNGQDDDAKEILVRNDMGFYVCASVNSPEDFAIFSFHANGIEDTDFGNNGKTIIDIDDEDNISEGVLLPNGDILLGGESNEDDDPDFAVVKIEGYTTCSDVTVNQSLEGCDSVDFDGMTYTNTQVTNVVYKLENGCDSTVVLDITIKNSSASSMNEMACKKVTVNNVDYNMSGAYQQTFTNAEGCDSILTINVIILESTSETIAPSSCSPVTVNAITYDESGSYQQTLVNAAGCDSILTVNVAILESTSETISESSCDPITVNAVTYDESGSYQQNLINEDGCDSTLTVNITILEPANGTISRSSCTPVTVNDVTYGETGSYQQNLMTVDGCDSILTVNVTIEESISATIAESDCLPITINDVTYDESGSYQQTLVSVDGCDSILTIEVTIEPLLSTISIVGDTVLVSDIEAEEYQWINCADGTLLEGETSSSFSITTSGEFALIVIQENCIDTSDCVAVAVSPVLEIDHQNKIKLYPNPASSLLTIENLSTNRIETFAILDTSGKLHSVVRFSAESQIKVNLGDSPSGLYYLSVRYENGDHEMVKFMKI